MVFAKALRVLFILSLTSSGDSQSLKNYDNSTVKRANSKPDGTGMDIEGSITAEGSKLPESKQNIKGIDSVFSFIM